MLLFSFYFRWARVALTKKLIIAGPINTGSYKNTTHKRHNYRYNKKDIIEQLSRTEKTTYKNLTKTELEVLEELKRRNNITITGADKCGAIVIQYVQQCIKEAEKTNNMKNYRSLPNDKRKINYDTVIKTIKSLEKAQFIRDKQQKD